MTIEKLATEYRLKITRDECNDQIIQGRRGSMYVDGGKLCAIWIDSRPMKRVNLEQLGGSLWMGDISELNGRRSQDVKIRDISSDKIKLAIRLTGCHVRRILTQEQLDRLAKIGRDGLCRIKSAGEKEPRQSVESISAGSDVPVGQK